MNHAVSRGETTPSRARSEIAIHPEWFAAPEVQEAIRASGWPDCTAADLLQALLDVVDAIETRAEVLDRVLRERGLSFAEFCELVADVKLHEGPLHTLSPAEERGVRRLFLAGFDSDQIAGILELAPFAVHEYVAKQKYLAQGPLIVQLHLKGLTPVQIVEEARVPRSTVYSILADVGMTPHRSLRKLSEDKKQRILSMYRDGASYVEIMRRVRVDKAQLTNTLRLAHRRGALPEYGSRAS